jgi:hypothetical protein
MSKSERETLRLTTETNKPNLKEESVGVTEKLKNLTEKVDVTEKLKKLTEKDLFLEQKIDQLNSIVSNHSHEQIEKNKMDITTLIQKNEKLKTDNENLKKDFVESLTLIQKKNDEAKKELKKLYEELKGNYSQIKNIVLCVIFIIIAVGIGLSLTRNGKLKDPSVENSSNQNYSHSNSIQLIMDPNISISSQKIENFLSTLKFQSSDSSFVLFVTTSGSTRFKDYFPLDILKKFKNKKAMVVLLKGAFVCPNELGVSKELKTFLNSNNFKSIETSEIIQSMSSKEILDCQEGKKKIENFFNQ